MILIYHTKQSLHLQNTTIFVHQSTTKKTGADSIKHFTSRTCILLCTEMINTVCVYRFYGSTRTSQRAPNNKIWLSFNTHI